MTPTAASAAFMAANPEDPIPGDLTAEPVPADLPEVIAEALPDDFVQISREDFRAQLQMAHHVAGFALEARLGAPCPIGAASEAENGVKAIDAIYNLAERNDRMRRLVLSAKGGVWGDVMAVAMHGYTVLQIVRTAIASRLPEDGSAMFKSVRTA